MRCSHKYFSPIFYINILPLLFETPAGYSLFKVKKYFLRWSPCVSSASNLQMTYQLASSFRLLDFRFSQQSVNSTIFCVVHRVFLVAAPQWHCQCSGCKSSASLAGQDLYRAASLLTALLKFLWLIVAYHVEFCGTCAFLLLWFASVVFLCAHAWVGTHLMTARTKFMQ